MVRLMIDDQYGTMPWDALDAVVFDVGNVLLTFSPEKLLAELFPDDGALRATLMERMFRSPYWVMLDHGTLSSEEAVTAMAGRDASLRPIIAQVLEYRLNLKQVIQEGLDALHACRAHGKKTYVLSNYQDYAFQYVYDRYDFFRLFDGLVISAREGLVKPDPAIYKTLTDRYGLDPARTLFIDDAAANIEGAIHAGWQGFWFNRPGKLSAFFGA